MRGLIHFAGIVSTHRRLLVALVQRDLRDRFSGQAFGLVWTLGHPLVLMLLYAFLFAYVFPARFTAAAGAATFDYAPSIFAGLVCWLTAQEVLARSPTVLQSHASLVKQIVFPTELLPLKSTLASSTAQIVTLTFAVGYAAYKGTLGPFSLLLPIAVLSQLALMTGAAYMLSSLGAYFRDIKDVIQVVLMVGLFALPVLYNPHALPSWMMVGFYANPLSYLIWCYQDALYFAAPVHPVAWVVAPVSGIVMLALGYTVFQRAKHGFGDVL
jgi:lipopolysaccharide transport system permease protein